jgi:hypothetical protein
VLGLSTQPASRPADQAVTSKEAPMNGHDTTVTTVEEQIAKAEELLVQLGAVAQAFAENDLPLPADLNEVLQQLGEVEVDTVRALDRSLLLGVRG